MATSARYTAERASRFKVTSVELPVEVIAALEVLQERRQWSRNRAIVDILRRFLRSQGLLEKAV